MTGDMGSTMSMPLLPAWLRVVWVVVLAGVAAVHIWHSRSAAGQRRWWHAAHTAMALGMLGMYAANPMSQHGLDEAIVVIFAVLTITVAVTAGMLHRRERVLNPLWVDTAIVMLAMTYMALAMLLPAAARPTVLNWIFVVYLAGHALVWAFRVWGRVSVLRPATAAPRSTVGLPAHCTPPIRASLVVMATAMGYMLTTM